MRLGLAALLALPGLLLVYLGFDSGGFFPGATGVAAVVLAVALALRVTLAGQPFAGVSGAVLGASAALALLAVVTLLSAAWSEAPARALLEFDRTLLYLFALVLFGSIPLRAHRLEWALRGFAAAATLVCLIGLASRVAPDVLPVSLPDVVDRLSYPLSYWNALGLLAVLATIACLHVASGPRQPTVARAVAAAAIPPLLVTLLLTFSRGAIGAGLIAILVYLALARPWGMLGTALAVTLPAAAAVVAGYRADLLATITPTTPAAVAQGHRLALVVVICTLVAGGLRAALAGLDTTLERRAERAAARRSGGTRGRTVAAVGLAAVVAVALAVALGVPDRVGQQIAQFRSGETVQGGVRDRLTSASDNGRLEHWRVAVEAASRAPLLGEGAGTYQNLWAAGRRTAFGVVDAHSLYLETVAELGLVGLALLLATLGVMLAALLRRARGAQRSLYAALIAAFVAWGIHTGVDWHWEMPVVTLWVFALGGLAIAAPSSGRPAGGPAPLTRIAAALGCLLLALTPALVALSQRELDSSLAAFRRGDCAATVRAALDSAAYVSVRPQPYELMAYCDVRAGLPDLAIKAMDKALVRDPHNWEYEYGLGIVRATGGLDPRRQIAAASRLNPLGELPREASRAFRTNKPQEWKRRAVKARLPVRF